MGSPKRTKEKGLRTLAEIVGANAHKLGKTPRDQELRDFVDACFQEAIEDRKLQPCWVCVSCGRLRYGKTPKPQECDCCDDPQAYAVGNFQARAAVCGAVFQEAARHILDRYCPDLGLERATEAPDRDHSDIHVPGVVGVELKGSPSHVRLRDGKVVTLGRAGMRRTDTEKKAASNAATYKRDNSHDGQTPGFYVLTNEVPEKGWQEEHASIDRVYDITKRKDLEHFAEDVRHHKRRASRPRARRRNK